jgi:hypothetical protein
MPPGAFVLILTLSAPGYATETVPVGMMINHQSCAVAGAGMKHVLESATPGITIAWTCLPKGEVA